MVIVKEPNKVTIDADLKDALQSLVEDEAQVIIHIHLHFRYTSCIRIWKSTFLIPHNSATKINLAHAVNISFFPKWKICKSGETVCTLFFKGLPKDCTEFDLVEEIPESGGFYFPNIKKNNSGVYHLQINYNN
jgi:hypothetical protein